MSPVRANALECNGEYRTATAAADSVAVLAALYRALSASFRFGRRDLPVAALVAAFLRGAAFARGLCRMGGGCRPKWRVAPQMSSATQLAFSGGAFMLFVRAFDPILILGAIVWQLFGDFVWPARRIGKSIGSELHDLSYREFVHFESPSRQPDRQWPHLWLASAHAQLGQLLQYLR